MNTIAKGPRARPASVTGRQASVAEGSPLDGHKIRTAAAEALGTFILVLAITSTAVAVALVKPLAGAPYGSLAVPVAGGLALAVLVAGLGPVTILIQQLPDGGTRVASDTVASAIAPYQDTAASDVAHRLDTEVLDLLRQVTEVSGLH